MMELSVMVIQMLNRTQEKNRKGNLEFCYLNLFYSNFEYECMNFVCVVYFEVKLICVD